MQPATHGADWRPGTAKRGPRFDEYCALAVSWRPGPNVTTAIIKDAIAVGTPDLTWAERGVLGALATFLNQADLAKGVAFVFPSTRLLAHMIGESETSIRGYKKRLEDLGFLIRDYNHANRPAGDEAICLGPTVARLGELLANVAEARARRKAETQEWQRPQLALIEGGAQAPGTGRLEQSPENASSSVPGADAPEARSEPSRRRQGGAGSREDRKSSNTRRASRRDGANCSPGGASGSDGADRPALVDIGEAVGELEAALQLCPRLAPLVPQRVLDNPAAVTASDMAAWMDAAQQLLPDPDRNNAETCRWGLARHGARVVVMLALALEDPTVKDPCKFFGWAVTRPRGGVDLRSNLAGALRARGVKAPPTPQLPAAALVGGPNSDDPTWLAIDKHLLSIIRAGAHGSWFGRVGFHGIAGGVLHISTPSATAAARIKDQFLEPLRTAALRTGLEVDRVVVMLRPS